MKIWASLCLYVAFIGGHSYLSCNNLKDRDSSFLPCRNGTKLYTTEATHFQEKWWDQYSQDILTRKPWKRRADIFSSYEVKVGSRSTSATHQRWSQKQFVFEWTGHWDYTLKICSIFIGWASNYFSDLPKGLNQTAWPSDILLDNESHFFPLSSMHTSSLTIHYCHSEMSGAFMPRIHKTSPK